MIEIHGFPGAGKFQFTPPREGRPILNMYRVLHIRFQFTPPREGRLPLLLLCFRLIRKVSIHAPARGATLCPMPRSDGVILFQFTPPREGRHAPVITNNQTFIVSIHAPARGATGTRNSREDAQEVSIHAPTRGATPYSSFLYNSRTSVSIHAPTRGATISIIIKCRRTWFQFTPPREGRHLHP